MNHPVTRLFVALGTVITASSTHAVLIPIGPGSFTPQATVIDFDVADVPLGTINPSFTLPTTSLGMVTVSFAGAFNGQTVGGIFPRTLIGTVPSAPLSLNPAEITFTTIDLAPGATSPVLSGDPIFNGPIAVLFSTPVAAVALKGGFFDALSSTTIEAYDSSGNSLGSVLNTVTGFEFFGLADSSGLNVISGISFYITGDEPAGFQIDDLTFGSARELDPSVPIIPETSTVLSGLGLAGLFGFGAWRRFRQA